MFLNRHSISPKGDKIIPWNDRASLGLFPSFPFVRYFYLSVTELHWHLSSTPSWTGTLGVLRGRRDVSPSPLRMYGHRDIRVTAYTLSKCPSALWPAGKSPNLFSLPGGPHRLTLAHWWQHTSYSSRTALGPEASTGQTLNVPPQSWYAVRKEPVGQRSLSGSLTRISRQLWLSSVHTSMTKACTCRIKLRYITSDVVYWHPAGFVFTQYVRKSGVSPGEDRPTPE